MDAELWHWSHSFLTLVSDVYQHTHTPRLACPLSLSLSLSLSLNPSSLERPLPLNTLSQCHLSSCHTWGVGEGHDGFEGWEEWIDVAETYSHTHEHAHRERRR